MTPDAGAWARVGTLFDELADLPPGERTHRLAHETLAPELRHWLDRLLAAHDQPGCDVLERTLDGLVRDLTAGQRDELQFIPNQLNDHRFGNWRARGEIARGGMAVVLHGERADGHFQKEVAIKVLLPGPYTQRHHQRFVEEIRILARLEHAHIARLIDGGVSAEGWPYLVMEYVDGVPITHYCAAHGLDLEARLRLWQDVAAAVTHAHRHLVVHCDIKPSNVLVNRDHQVKLVDFGIAGLLSMARGDDTHPVLRCSPAYAAPEQIQGSAPATAQDVFSLGALLYELLCGARVRDARQLTSLVLTGAAADTPITPPSQAAAAPTADGPAQDRSTPAGAPQHGPLRWRRRLRGDGDAICLHALAGDPEQRYPTVNAFSADVRRWQHHEAVNARHGGRLYHAGKWLLRNRWLAGGALLAALSLGTGTAVALWQARQARAEAALSGATRDFLLEMFNAVDPWRNQQTPVSANELLDQAVARLPQRLNRHPAQKAEILHALGEILRRMGRADEALPLHQQAVDLLHPVDSPAARHRMLVGLANDQLDLLDFAAGAAALEPVLNQAPWPPQHASAVEARLLQIQLLTRLGQLQEQNRLLTELLEALPSIEALPDSAPLLADLYLVAAETKENQAAYAPALEYARQAIHWARRSYGDGHPVEARAHSYIATTQHAQGAYEEASQAMERFLAIARRYYGNGHPEVRWGEYTMARILNDKGDFRAAVAIYEALVNQLIAEYGADDPRLGVTYANLGKAWRGLGDLQQAVAYFARGLPITARAEADHPKLGTYYTLYAQALSETGNHPLAEDYFQRGLTILHDKLGTDHPVYASAQVAWSEHLLRIGQPQRALPLLQHAYPLLRDNQENDSPQTAMALKALGQATADTGQTAQARQYWQQALDILQLPRNRPAHQTAINELRQQLQPAG